MFFEQLNIICNQRNIKLTPLLTKIGVSKGNINSWKKGNIPSGDILLKLANELDVSVDYLLGRTDNPNSHK